MVANVGRVALRYEPLIHNFESVDQNLDHALESSAPLAVEWGPDLQGGVMVINGALAIPNCVRNYLGGRSVVWIKDLD